MIFLIGKTFGYQAQTFPSQQLLMMACETKDMFLVISSLIFCFKPAKYSRVCFRHVVLHSPRVCPPYFYLYSQMFICSFFHVLSKPPHSPLVSQL